MEVRDFKRELNVVSLSSTVKKMMNAKETLSYFIVGFFLNFLFPFTYSQGLTTKPVFSIGNPLLILIYALLIFIGVRAVSPYDQKHSSKIGKFIVDKPKDIPKTIIVGILQIVFGIIFLLIIPGFGSAILYWQFNLPVKLLAFVFLAYIAIFVYIGRRTYWSKYFKS